ncbi:MAG: NUDIX hydrolase [Planctomycetota bacterium]
MSDDDIRAPHLRENDFLGVFAVVQRDDRILMVQNERTIGGRTVRTWDLPGGQVEPGELLHEALLREVREETALHVRGEPRFLFVQEGRREAQRRRRYVWRSFFFACEADGVPMASSEVLGVAWFARTELAATLTAPYHDSFRAWLEDGGGYHASTWCD